MLDTLQNIKIPGILKQGPELSCQRTKFSVQSNLERDYLFKKSRGQIATENLAIKLKLCSNVFVKETHHCKQCEEHNKSCSSLEHHDTIIKEPKITPYYCGVRYCSNVNDKVYQFSEMIEELKSIKRLKDLKRLEHFAIGFSAISLEEYRTDFTRHKKRYEQILNVYFEKLRKKNVIIQAIRVLDFSYATKNMVYPHFHFVAIPFKNNDKRRMMMVMQETRKKMISSMKNKKDFHVQFFQRGSKTGLFSYVALRSIGLYKPEKTEKFEYKITKKATLKESILSNKYFMLKDVISLQIYMKDFYNKRHYVTIGGLPYGSIITDNVLYECKYHGVLDRKSVRVEREMVKNIEEKEPPPDEVRLNVQMTKIGRDVSRPFNEEIPDEYYEAHGSCFESHNPDDFFRVAHYTEGEI